MSNEERQRWAWPADPPHPLVHLTATHFLRARSHGFRIVASRFSKSRNGSVGSSKVDALAPSSTSEGRRRVKLNGDPADVAARLGAPVLADFHEFGALIRRSARTVSRMEKMGLPVLRPGRTPLVPVERALRWIEAGRRKSGRGRPRNVCCGSHDGGRS